MRKGTGFFKVVVFAAAVLSAVSVSFANVRAPYYRDNHFSGSARTASNPPGLVLAHESMKILFPNLVERGYTGTACFEIVYVLSNLTSGTVELPVDFLGINVELPKAYFNGEALAVARTIDNELAKECAVKLSEHRSSWNTNIYRHYLDRVRYVFEYRNVNGYLDPNPNWLPELRSMRADDPRLHRMFFEGFAGGVTNEFCDYAMTLRLRPGRNVLSIDYRQEMFLNENNAGYAFRLIGSTVGFDYLLYPALTWKLSPGFTFDVNVDVPDFVRQGTLFRRYYRPRILSSLPLTDTYDQAAHTHHFTGNYTNYPAQIFTFLAEAGQ